MDFKIFGSIMKKKRYLVVFTALFVAALAASMNSQFWQTMEYDPGGRPGLLFGLLALFLAAAVFLFRFSGRLRKVFRFLGFAALTVSVLCAGIIYPAMYYRVFFSRIAEFDQSTALVFGTVCSEPKLSLSGKSISFKLDVSYIESGGKSLDNKGNIWLYIPVDESDGAHGGSDSDVLKNSGIEYGSGIKFTAQLRQPDNYIEDFAYRRYMLSNACPLISRTKSYELYSAVPTVRGNFLYFGHLMREKIAEYAEYVIPDADSQALFKGILLGMKDDFSDELYNNLSGSGFMHIAAVSGLHVMFLCTVLEFLFRFISHRRRGAVIIPLLLVFTCIAAFTPSVCRASVMMSIVLLSRILLRDADTPTSLFFAALVLVISNPYVIYSISFIMSFSATLSLIIFYRPLAAAAGIAARKAAKIILPRHSPRLSLGRGGELCISCLKKLAEFFIVPIACQILIIPLSVYYFGKISLGAIAANIIVIPCTMVAFSAGLINFVIYLIFPAAAKAAAFVLLSLPLRIICRVAAALANSWLNIAFDYRPGMIAFAVYALLCAALYSFLENVAHTL